MEKDMKYMNFSDVSRFLFLPNDCGSFCPITNDCARSI